MASTCNEEDDEYEDVAESSDTYHVYDEISDSIEVPILCMVDEQMDINEQETNKSVSQKEIRIAIVGRTGSGKSSLGNQILSEHLFENDLSPVSVTGNTNVKWRIRNGIKIVVADTPGLFHTNISERNIKKQMLKCIELLLPGPHVFLYTIKIGRHSDEEITSIKRFIETFGDNAFNYTVIAFTGKDYLVNENIDMYVENLPNYFQTIAKQCNRRIVAFDNFATEDENQQQWDQLLFFINNIIHENKDLKSFCADMVPSKTVLEILKEGYDVFAAMFGKH